MQKNPISYRNNDISAIFKNRARSLLSNVKRLMRTLLSSTITITLSKNDLPLPAMRLICLMPPDNDRWQIMAPADH